jgi:hypothetical protein
MQIIQTANEVPAPPTNVVRPHDARAEIDQLMTELHSLVSRGVSSGRGSVDEALRAAAKLQVVTANVDACNPSRRPGIAAELVGLADLRVRSRRDAIERSLGYTAEATMRRLTGEPGADPEARTFPAVARAMEGRRS